MAIYKKLLLSAGGGIISACQQAEQAEDTAAILIGLGTTGIDCIRTIKTQVYTRLKPDNPDEATPKYARIRFLGVDTDERSLEADSIMALDDTEFFSIGNPGLWKTLSIPQSFQSRPELNWFRWEDYFLLGETPLNRGASAGSVRQMGRLMMMERSESFINRLEQEIERVKSGLKQPCVKDV